MPSMHIGLQSWGTEGDLRPFLTLARALLQRGHRVELVFTGVMNYLPNIDGCTFFVRSTSFPIEMSARWWLGEARNV